MFSMNYLGIPRIAIIAKRFEKLARIIRSISAHCSFCDIAESLLERVWNPQQTQAITPMAIVRRGHSHRPSQHSRQSRRLVFPILRSFRPTTVTISRREAIKLEPDKND
jgi:hypothetical protein